MNSKKISLGNLNPIDAAFSCDPDNEDTARLRRIAIAKEVERWHFDAGIALAVLADRIHSWRYIAGCNNTFSLEDSACLADNAWERVINQLVAIANAPWCAGLEFWEQTNLGQPRNTPIYIKSASGLSQAILDKLDAVVVVAIKL